MRSERSASRASVQSEEGVSQSSEAAEGRDATNNRHSSDKGEIPDSAIQAVSDVTLRMVRLLIFLELIDANLFVY